MPIPTVSRVPRHSPSITDQFWKTVSCSPGYPLTPCVAKVDLELQTLLSPLPKCWDDMRVTAWFMWCRDLSPRFGAPMTSTLPLNPSPSVFSVLPTPMRGSQVSPLCQDWFFVEDLGTLNRGQGKTSTTEGFIQGLKFPPPGTGLINLKAK